MFNRLLLICAAGTAVFSCFSASAQEMSGAKDHPAIKRFAGSSIVAYQTKRFDEADIPTSSFTRFNLQSKKREFVSAPIKAEGERTRIWY